jgi:predicted GTPase
MVNTVEAKTRDTKRWNFGTRLTPLALEEFIARKTESFKFFEGSEPWVRDHDRITWENFFRFCTEEMDDLSILTCGMVIEYCLSVIEQTASKIKRPVTRAKIQDALAASYAEAYENPVFQYRWAMRHPIVAEAVNTAVRNLCDDLAARASRRANS